MAQWVKLFATKQEDQRLKPRSHIWEGENWVLQVFLWYPYSCITLTTTSTCDHRHTETHINTKMQLNKCNELKKEKDGVWESTHRLRTAALLEDIGVVVSIPKTTPNLYNAVTGYLTP